MTVRNKVTILILTYYWLRLLCGLNLDGRLKILPVRLDNDILLVRTLQLNGRFHFDLFLRNNALVIGAEMHGMFDSSSEIINYRLLVTPKTTSAVHFHLFRSPLLPLSPLHIMGSVHFYNGREACPAEGTDCCLLSSKMGPEMFLWMTDLPPTDLTGPRQLLRKVQSRVILSVMSLFLSPVYPAGALNIAVTTLEGVFRVLVRSCDVTVQASSCCPLLLTFRTLQAQLWQQLQLEAVRAMFAGLLITLFGGGGSENVLLTAHKGGRHTEIESEIKGLVRTTGDHQVSRLLLQLIKSTVQTGPQPPS